MALLEELLKSSRAHPQSVIVALIALIVVGAVGGGLWIHNLQSMLESRDALQKQELALVTERMKDGLYRLEERVDILDETVKHHQVFLEETSSKLKQLAKGRGSIEVNHQIEQIADDLQRSKEQLDAVRKVDLRYALTTRSNITGSAGPPLSARPSRSTPFMLIAVAIVVIGGFWMGIVLYK